MLLRGAQPLNSMATNVHNTFSTTQRVAQSPERFSLRTAMLLASGDAAMTLIFSFLALAQAPNPIGAAVLTSGVICGTFWLCGLYRRSHAVMPRDEVYFACAGVIYAAVPVFVVLTAIAQADAGSVLLALLLSALAASVWRVRMHLQRRAGPPPYAGIPTITPHGWHDRESGGFLLAKRAFDITVAVLALCITLPLMLAAALAIAVESGMPVLFSQHRVGRDGRVFKMYKFRTMRQDAGPEWARPGDTRITRVGAVLRRSSIDELPQLFNVLRGEMSIVGPRPEMVEFARRFAREMPSYDQRHVVWPGITGWAQLYHKRNLEPDDVKEILPYDLYYVERASPLLDAAIVLKTAAEVLLHRAV